MRRNYASHTCKRRERPTTSDECPRAGEAHGSPHTPPVFPCTAAGCARLRRYTAPSIDAARAAAVHTHTAHTHRVRHALAVQPGAREDRAPFAASGAIRLSSVRRCRTACRRIVCLLFATWKSVDRNCSSVSDRFVASRVCMPRVRRYVARKVRHLVGVVSHFLCVCT